MSSLSQNPARRKPPHFARHKSRTNRNLHHWVNKQGVLYVMDNSCHISDSLVAWTCQFLYFRWVRSRSTGDCDNCYPGQGDFREKTARLIV